MNHRRNLRIAAAATAAALTTLSFAGVAAAKPVKDSDRDGMSDTYEKANGLNQRRADGSGDKDGDKLTNLAEFKAGTSAAKADTDGDSLPDGYEVEKKLNPKRNDADSDPDADGLANKIERMLGLDPRSADTDRDGTKDGDEDADRDGIRNSADKKPKVYDKPAAAKATVASFDEATGVLTVKFAKGMSVTVAVTDDTELEWHGRSAACADPASIADLTPGRGIHEIEYAKSKGKARAASEDVETVPGETVPGETVPDDSAPADPEPTPEPTAPEPTKPAPTTPAPSLVADEISLVCS